MHPVKSKFLTVNVEDRMLMYLDLVKISHTLEYIYLGTPMSNQSITNQARDHIEYKIGSKLKFYSSLNKNRSAQITPPPPHLTQNTLPHDFTSSALIAGS